MAAKKKDKAALVSLSIEELTTQLAIARRDVARLRMELMMGQLKDTAKYLVAKKEVARLLTAISAKKISEVII